MSSLSDLSDGTLRVVAAAIQFKVRHGHVSVMAVELLANHEVGCDVDAALQFLGLPSHYSR